MGIEQELNEKLKSAMKEKNSAELNAIRMVKSFASKEKSAPLFSGETDDAFWLETIKKYVKQQQKAVVELEKLGVGGDQLDGLKFEIAFFSPYLPKKLSAEQIGRLVEEAIAITNASSVKQMGQVMGLIMKAHKDEVDGGLVRQIITDKLS